MDANQIQRIKMASNGGQDVGQILYALQQMQKDKQNGLNVEYRKSYDGNSWGQNIGSYGGNQRSNSYTQKRSAENNNQSGNMRRNYEYGSNSSFIHW